MKAAWVDKSKQKFVLRQNDLSVYQGTPAITDGFNRWSEDYVNFVSSDKSAQIMSTQNDGQNSGR